VLAAHTVAALHAAAVLFMVSGSLLALRWPRLLLLHGPVALAILGIYLTGSDCPLTSLELWLRGRAGLPAYSGGFIGHYVTEPLGFPIHATSTQVGVVLIAVLPNVVGYGLLARRLSALRVLFPHWQCCSTRNGRTAPAERGSDYSNECSGPGNTPPRTSSAYSLAARSSSARRSAYFFTKRGTRPPV
jgi:hypothetical protein